jgi:hypothetical protein
MWFTIFLALMAAILVQVLKTKDYIDVEQAQPYSEIYLTAQPKLIKARF